MAATSTASPPREPLRRSMSGRHLGGVCAGLGRHLGVAPLVVRIAFVGAGAAGGVGLRLSAAAWILIPADDAREAPKARRLPRGRAAIEVALGVGLLTLSVLLTMRALGLWFSDVLVWPVLLLAAGAGLLWRQSMRPTAAG